MVGYSPPSLAVNLPIVYFGPNLASEDERLPDPHKCNCSASGRRLVVCIDGTSNKFSRKVRLSLKLWPSQTMTRCYQNTNVVELYDNLVKDPEKQLTYYSSGLGTYAKSVLKTPSLLGRAQQIVGYQLDLAFAWCASCFHANLSHMSQALRENTSRCLSVAVGKLSRRRSHLSLW